MPKETTYQRNKRLLFEANQKLMIVCNDPESLAGQTIIGVYKHLKELDEMLFFGEYTESTDMEGLIKKIC